MEIKVTCFISVLQKIFYLSTSQPKKGQILFPLECSVQFNNYLYYYIIQRTDFSFCLFACIEQTPKHTLIKNYRHCYGVASQQNSQCQWQQVLRFVALATFSTTPRWYMRKFLQFAKIRFFLYTTPRLYIRLQFAIVRLFLFASSKENSRYNLAERKKIMKERLFISPLKKYQIFMMMIGCFR